MASNVADFGGYDYHFVETPPDDLMCLICTCVARDPQQLVCCGRVFCRECLSNHKKYSNNCPQCRQPSKEFNDTRSDRHIKGLKVKCDNRGNGCKWTGELRSIADHHDKCGYCSIQCPNHCSDGSKVVFLLRKNLKGHLSRKCPKRQYKCPHCNELGEYEERTTSHLEVCEFVDVQCPNQGCTKIFPRFYLREHSFNCPFQVLDCTNHCLGCTKKVLRKDLYDHSVKFCVKRDYVCLHCGENGVYDLMTTEHLDSCPNVLINCPNTPCDCRLMRCEVGNHRLVCDYELMLCKYGEIGCHVCLFRKDIATHEMSIEEHFTTALETVVAQNKIIKELKEKVDENSCRIEPLFHFKLAKFTELKRTDSEFYTEPFYTHPRGYKIILCVNANGNMQRESSRGTHVSVYVHLTKGKFDGELQWPFPGTVTVTLLNQLEDKHHYSARISIPPDESDCGGRVGEEGERGVGYGRHKFIAHAELGYSEADNCQYLEEDCLYFRIDTDIPNVKPWLMC